MAETKKPSGGGCGGCLGLIVGLVVIVVIIVAIAGGNSSSSTPTTPTTETTEQAPSPLPPETDSTPSESSGSESKEEDEVGSTSHAGDTKFCEEHHCIGEFTTEDGTVVECSDGTFSHAGGLSGACSDHGGEASGSRSNETEEEESTHE